jgi:hypothetical protein
VSTVTVIAICAGVPIFLLFVATLVVLVTWFCSGGIRS